MPLGGFVARMHQGPAEREFGGPHCYSHRGRDVRYEGLVKGGDEVEIIDSGLESLSATFDPPSGSGQHQRVFVAFLTQNSAVHPCPSRTPEPVSGNRSKLALISAITRCW